MEERGDNPIDVDSNAAIIWVRIVLWNEACQNENLVKSEHSVLNTMVDEQSRVIQRCQLLLIEA